MAIPEGNSPLDRSYVKLEPQDLGKKNRQEHHDYIHSWIASSFHAYNIHTTSLGANHENLRPSVMAQTHSPNAARGCPNPLNSAPRWAEEQCMIGGSWTQEGSPWWQRPAGGLQWRIYGGHRLSNKSVHCAPSSLWREAMYIKTPNTFR